MQAQGLHKEGEAAGTGRYQKVSEGGEGKAAFLLRLSFLLISFHPC